MKLFSHAKCQEFDNAWADFQESLLELVQLERDMSYAMDNAPELVNDNPELYGGLRNLQEEPGMASRLQLLDVMRRSIETDLEELADVVCDLSKVRCGAPLDLEDNDVGPLCWRVTIQDCEGSWDPRMSDNDCGSWHKYQRPFAMDDTVGPG